MAELTRLQVIDLRDKGVITPSRAADWIAILDQGAVLDVSQKLADQAASPESLLPIGITVSGDKEVEINFRDVTREGIFKLQQAGVLDAQQTVDLLAKAREVQASPESVGGKLVSAARAAFDPTDPRGVINIGPIPVKAGLAAAGLGLALPGAAVTAAPGLAVSTAAGGVLPTAAVSTAAGAVTGIAGRVASGAARLTGARPRSIPRLAATAGLGAAVGLPTAAALTGGDAIPELPASGPAEGPQQESAGARAAREALEAGANPDEAAEVAKQNTGVDVRFITRKVTRFNPATGQIEEVDAIIPITSETILDDAGNPQTIEKAGAPFFPQLAQAQFNLEQTEQNRFATLEAERFEIGQAILDREAASRDRAGFLQSIPSITEFFSMLADPRTANLLRISAARAGGQESVSGLQLPEQLGALFGLQPGQSLPSGVQGGREVAPDFSAIDSVPNLGAVGGVPVQRQDSSQDRLGGLLGSIGRILGEASSFQTPQLQSQLTPGTARSFSPEELGAAQAAFISSGTSLEEQQRIARRSALPGGSSFRR